MPIYSETSKAHLSKCAPELISLFNTVIQHRDCTIVCGYRDRKAQDDAYNNGHSKLTYPNSKHNKIPSLAVDVVPYIKGSGPTWDLPTCYYFAGFVLGIAATIHIKIRCGADWDMDMDVRDQQLLDPYHFELLHI